MEVKAEASGGASADAAAVTTPNPSTPSTDAPAAAAAATPSSSQPPAAGSSSSPSSSPPTAVAAAAGEQSLASMNAAFAKTLALVCPPIQYPPHCRFNPVQQDAADTMELEARLEELFLHAKQLELLFLSSPAAAQQQEQQQQQSELEVEVVNLESELNEKHDLIEKYMDVIRGWEGKFKRLETRMALERE